MLSSKHREMLQRNKKQQQAQPRSGAGAAVEKREPAAAAMAAEAAAEAAIGGGPIGTKAPAAAAVAAPAAAAVPAPLAALGSDNDDAEADEEAGAAARQAAPVPLPQVAAAGEEDDEEEEEAADVWAGQRAGRKAATVADAAAEAEEAAAEVAAPKPRQPQPPLPGAEKAAAAAAAAGGAKSKAKRLPLLAARGAARAARLAAARMQRALLEKDAGSVVLAALLLVVAAWALSLKRKLTRSLAQAQGLSKPCAQAFVFVAAACLWAPVALVKFLFAAPATASASASAPADDGSDWEGGSGPGFSAFWLASAAFAFCALIVTEAVIDTPIFGYARQARSAATASTSSDLSSSMVSVNDGSAGDGSTVALSMPLRKTHSDDSSNLGADAGDSSSLSGAADGSSSAMGTDSARKAAIAANPVVVAQDVSIMRLWLLCVGFLTACWSSVLWHGDGQVTAPLVLGTGFYIAGLVMAAGVEVRMLWDALSRGDHVLARDSLFAVAAAVAAETITLLGSGKTAGGSSSDVIMHRSRGGRNGKGDADDDDDAAEGRSRELTHVVDGGALATATRVLSHIWEDGNSRKIFLFLVINFLFMFVEIAVGWLTNSLGLISDAGHMFFDNASLFIGLYASYMARWKPDRVYTYGYARYEVLAGFVNAIFLVFVGLSVVFEALERLWEPPEIHGDHLLTVSVLGLVVNLIGLVFFHDFSHGHGDHGGHSHGGGHGHSHGGGTNENMHGVFLHVLADTLGSAGVIVSSLLIKYYGWNLADPIASIFISVLILLSVVPLIQATAGPLLSRVPEALEAGLVRGLGAVRKVPGVVGVDSTHFWKFHSSEVVGTLHVRVAADADGQRVLRQVHSLVAACGVSNVTVQIDRDASVVLGDDANKTIDLGSIRAELEAASKVQSCSDSADHGHSHAGGGHGHSHGGGDHGHSHAGGDHGHGHGASKTKSSEGHGHSHGGKPCGGHGHGHGGGDDHGHSHG
jgi:zinc transporter 5/7